MSHTSFDNKNPPVLAAHPSDTSMGYPSPFHFPTLPSTTTPMTLATATAPIGGMVHHGAPLHSIAAPGIKPGVTAEARLDPLGPTALSPKSASLSITSQLSNNPTEGVTPTPSSAAADVLCALATAPYTSLMPNTPTDTRIALAQSAASAGVMTRARAQRQRKGPQITSPAPPPAPAVALVSPDTKPVRKRGRPPGRKTQATKAEPRTPTSVNATNTATGKRRRTNAQKASAKDTLTAASQVRPAADPVDTGLSGSTAARTLALPAISAATSSALYAVASRSTRPRRAAARGSDPNEVVDTADGHYIIKIDKVLNQRYRILCSLGQGTFGRVVKCLDLTTGKECAVKVIRSVQKYRDAAKTEIKVLDRIRSVDPENRFQCIHLQNRFEYRNHVCMVFDLLDSSIFDYLKSNDFHAFPMHQIQHFAAQLLRSVAFLHRLKLVHTDLKPENVLLVSTDSKEVPSYRHPKRPMKVLTQTDIQLIDFGSATFEHDYHSSVVSTRHYRAPEIIMGLGWSYPCDMWSIGCILMEFFTGDALFQTHKDLEHLAMMERVLGPLPQSMIARTESTARTMFSGYKLNFPGLDATSTQCQNVNQLKPLADMVSRDANTVHTLFYDLLRGLLTFDPARRLTAEEALQHDFLRLPLDEAGRLRMAALSEPLPPAPLGEATESLPTTPTTRPPYARLGPSRLVPNYPSTANAGVLDLPSPSFMVRSRIPLFMQPAQGRAAIGAPSPRFPPGHYLASATSARHDGSALQPLSPFTHSHPMTSTRSADTHGALPSASPWASLPMQQHSSAHLPNTAPLSASVANSPRYKGPHTPGLPAGPFGTGNYAMHGSHLSAANIRLPGLSHALSQATSDPVSPYSLGFSNASYPEPPTSIGGGSSGLGSATLPMPSNRGWRHAPTAVVSSSGDPGMTSYATAPHHHPVYPQRPSPASYDARTAFPAPPINSHPAPLSPLSRLQQQTIRRPPNGTTLRRSNRPSPLAALAQPTLIRDREGSNGNAQSPLVGSSGGGPLAARAHATPPYLSHAYHLPQQRPDYDILPSATSTHTSMYTGSLPSTPRHPLPPPLHDSDRPSGEGRLGTVAGLPTHQQRMPHHQPAPEMSEYLYGQTSSGTTVNGAAYPSSAHAYGPTVGVGGGNREPPSPSGGTNERPLSLLASTAGHSSGASPANYHGYPRAPGAPYYLPQ
ncbi:serine threonine protein kinase CMGC group [Dimargaris verticillata]|uniref:Serine threonine protein kinase CMGC group n=1 Tax=Dimargaris verticillata TaxID=2761393 RepID=A0A9W8EE68_9FUNG|nr:serine threonine protein kinase CMGC group [Dimargaris verticillata]